jgi:AhpD family alkylhydroperoxidase
MTNTQHIQPRLDYARAAPGAREAMYAVEQYVRECGLDRRLLELVKLRASQINGCAYCVDMHTKDARAHGETEQRLYAVAGGSRTTPKSGLSSKNAILQSWTAIRRRAPRFAPPHVMAASHSSTVRTIRNITTPWR